VRKIADRSREMPEVGLGLSARACLALIRTSKAWAAASGRLHVVPEDILVLAPPILGHRLLLTAEAMFAGVTIDEVTRSLLASVPAPEDRS
jgi:MoxR-like ATPase